MLMQDSMNAPHLHLLPNPVLLIATLIVVLLLGHALPCV
jgi:hypothetical protein